MRTWREIVWRNAEALSLAKSPLTIALAKARIETYATTQAVLYKGLFARNKASAAERDAYCRSRQAS